MQEHVEYVLDLRFGRRNLVFILIVDQYLVRLYKLPKELADNNREELGSIQSVDGGHEDTVNGEQLVHLLLLGNHQAVEDVSVGLAVDEFVLLARETLVESLCQLLEHRVDIALADFVENTSEFSIGLKHLGSFIALVLFPAPHEGWFPGTDRGFFGLFFVRLP